ncbi:hypothetical protein [Celeribacter sp. ULVN23_4]
MSRALGAAPWQAEVINTQPVLVILNHVKQFTATRKAGGLR